MAESDDEDVVGWGIHDLDHAPEPRRSGGIMMSMVSSASAAMDSNNHSNSHHHPSRILHAAVVSPRLSRRRRSSGENENSLFLSSAGGGAASGTAGASRKRIGSREMTMNLPMSAGAGGERGTLMGSSGGNSTHLHMLLPQAPLLSSSSSSAIAAAASSSSKKGPTPQPPFSYPLQSSMSLQSPEDNNNNNNNNNTVSTRKQRPHSFDNDHKKAAASAALRMNDRRVAFRKSHSAKRMELNEDNNNNNNNNISSKKMFHGRMSQSFSVLHDVISSGGGGAGVGDSTWRGGHSSPSKSKRKQQQQQQQQFKEEDDNDDDNNIAKYGYNVDEPQDSYRTTGGASAGHVSSSNNSSTHSSNNNNNNNNNNMKLPATAGTATTDASPSHHHQHAHHHHQKQSHKLLRKGSDSAGSAFSNTNNSDNSMLLGLDDEDDDLQLSKSSEFGGTGTAATSTIADGAAGTGNSAKNLHPTHSATIRNSSSKDNHNNNNANDHDDGDMLSLWWKWSRLPSWNRVSTFVVTRAAPCFWWSRNRHPTDRTILFRLNVLCACLALVQLASFLWFTFVTLSPKHNEPLPDDSHIPGSVEPNGRQRTQYLTKVRFLSNTWNINGNIIILGCVSSLILVATIVTVRVIRNVNLIGAIRYLWLLLWVIPIEIYFVIALFDYFDVTGVWIKHAWREPTLQKFRIAFCLNGTATANTRCAVPVYPPVNETEWCLSLFNATDCVDIRNAAQDDFRTFMISYYYFNAAIGLAMICLLVLVVNTLQTIISRPLVQKSRESNVPAWLSLPVMGCLVAGLVFSFSKTSVLNTRSNTHAKWIGPLYLFTGGCFCCAALLGWYISAFSILSTRDKKQKILAVMLFIAGMGLILVLLAAIFCASIIFSVRLVNIPLSNEDRGTIACYLDQQTGSCSMCDANDGDMCPEWSISDVTTVLQNQVKGGAALAAIFVIYAMSALRFGIGLHKHITMYQIDYV